MHATSCLDAQPRGSVPGVSTLAEVEAHARQTLLELSLCATAAAAGLLPERRIRRTSTAPRDVGDPVSHWRARFREATTVVALERELEQARDELARLRRRPLAELAVETLEELERRAIDVGDGFDAQSVAVALRTSESIVRRARLRAGRDAETGRRLAPERANGTPMVFGLELVAAGYPIRVASALAGVAKSTLHEHLRAQP